MHGICRTKPIKFQNPANLKPTCYDVFTSYLVYSGCKEQTDKLIDQCMPCLHMSTHNSAINQLFTRHHWLERLFSMVHTIVIVLSAVLIAMVGTKNKQPVTMTWQKLFSFYSLFWLSPRSISLVDLQTVPENARLQVWTTLIHKQQLQ